jgi:hypothetical protein
MFTPDAQACDGDEDSALAGLDRGNLIGDAVEVGGVTSFSPFCSSSSAGCRRVNR